jgi:hypothetical protein
LLFLIAALLSAACAAAPATPATPTPAAPNVIAAPIVVAGGDAATPTMAPNAAPVAPTAAPAEAAPTETPIVVALPGLSGGAPPDLGPTVAPNGATQLTIGAYQLTARIVADPATRSQGLMFVTELPDDEGMLFVFPTDQQLSFWMRNTYIPLSIAFLDADRRILNIADMEPLDDRTFHASAGPARYALEVNQGWFAARGIAAGDIVEFMLPPDLVVQ